MKKQRGRVLLGSMTLVINSGSSSVKFGIFCKSKVKASIACWCRGTLEGIATNPIFKLDQCSDQKVTKDHLDKAQQVRFTTVEQAHLVLAEWVNTLQLPSKINMICYRLVHGGDFYQQPVTIDQQVLKNLESLVPFAPLHQPLGLNAIDVFMKHFPMAIHKACFDTSFHRSMPRVAQTFALPQSLTAQGIKPYGFHGLSYQYIASKLPELNQGYMPERVVVAHLGSGASMCALLNGKSIATSMTFSPLDGLPMATRCGSIDAAVILYMQSQLKMSEAEISMLLNKQSGLLGLSGISGDMRTLLDDSSTEASFAVEFFIYRICRELGAMVGLLKGLDALIFTGGVGTHCGQIREKVCLQFAWLGISLDVSMKRTSGYLLNDPSSCVKVYAIKTDEEIIMAELVS